jgi:hypothetical protein
MENNLPLYHPFNLIKRMDDFFDEFVNPFLPEFIVEDFKDGRKESEKQEDLIREFLINLNDKAFKYGFKFKNRLNVDDERSTEDLIIEDLFAVEPTEHLANIKSLQSKNVSNIGKDQIVGQILTGVNKPYKSEQIKDLFINMMENNDKKVTSGFYFYISYKKDKKTFSTHELGYMSQDDITINPTNFLQSKMAHKCVYRTSEERFNFLWENFRIYVGKNIIKYKGMDKYLDDIIKYL